MKISKRTVAGLAIAGLFACSGGVALLGAGSAHAGAPLARTAAPGFYRMMLGDFEVTALSDGTVALPMNQLLARTTPEKVDQALARSYLKSPVETSVNAYLINTGSTLVLVDTGAATLFGPTLGQLGANLRASGYRPEQVDMVLITHMHVDHIGGLVDGQQLGFPNATVHVDRRDADYWLSQSNLDRAPADSKDFFVKARQLLGVVQAAGRLRTFDGDTDLAPGIRAVASPGHTPGHSLFVAESRGQKLVLWGDLMHVAAVQFAEPLVTIRFDVDQEAAAAQRRKAYDAAAREGHWVGAAHIPFPGLGQVQAEGGAYRWVPVNWSALR